MRKIKLHRQSFRLLDDREKMYQNSDDYPRKESESCSQTRAEKLVSEEQSNILFGKVFLYSNVLK